MHLRKIHLAVVVLALTLVGVVPLPAAVGAGGASITCKDPLIEGPDYICKGTSGNDFIYGTVNADRIDGKGGNDSIYGYEGADRIKGNSGNDMINAGPDADVVDGSSGNDSINGDGGADILFGNSGDDSLSGGADADQIDGGIGRDMLNGNAGDDEVRSRDTSSLRRNRRYADLAACGTEADKVDSDINDLVNSDCETPQTLTFAIPTTP